VCQCLCLYMFMCVCVRERVCEFLCVLNAWALYMVCVCVRENVCVRVYVYSLTRQTKKIELF